MKQNTYIVYEYFPGSDKIIVFPNPTASIAKIRCNLEHPVNVSLK
jgi:hypothetical protein